MMSLNLGDYLHEVGQAACEFRAGEILACLLRKSPAYLVRVLAHEVGVWRKIFDGSVKFLAFSFWQEA